MRIASTSTIAVNFPKYGVLGPELQFSLPVHGLPSLQPALALFACLQPLAWSHESVVHAFASSQFSCAPWHLPLLQASLSVQALPSLQEPGQKPPQPSLQLPVSHLGAHWPHLPAASHVPPVPHLAPKVKLC